jgi:hypothetical protein
VTSKWIGIGVPGGKHECGRKTNMTHNTSIKTAARRKNIYICFSMVEKAGSR